MDLLFSTERSTRCPMTTADALANKLKAEGHQITPPPDSAKGYTFEARKGSECVAVLVKEHKAKANVSHIAQFEDYLESVVAKRFTGGWMISASGFSNPALTHVKAEEPAKLRLGTFEGGNLSWDYPALPGEPGGRPPPPPPPVKLRYFGVFTCKGGVGKTTVAAHLAGAFALMGFDVILVDLDPDKNLRKLFLQDLQDEEGDASLYVPPKGKGAGTTITVLNHDQWNETHYPDIRIVVCDCSPVLSENPRELVSKFDYCIIPTTLNPLGVAKKADVITRTFGQIREMNQKAEMFALINGYDATAEAAPRNRLLLDLLKNELDKYTSKDKKCKFIHPDDAKIRYSTALFYWGIHIVKGTKPELAFKEVAGRSYPRIDFLQLADYLEHHTDIDALKHLDANVRAGRCY
jgi:chromosome partitioning protein